MVDVLPSNLEGFKEKLNSAYLEKLDTGETESLAYLLSGHADLVLCSSDAIVFRVLGACAMG